jgi:hypothetical protein
MDAMRHPIEDGIIHEAMSGHGPQPVEARRHDLRGVMARAAGRAA